MTSPATLATANVQTALQHTASLLQRDPALAEEQALEILKQIPNEANAMQLLGTALRCQGKAAKALPVLEKVVARAPDYALAQQEIGLTLWVMGRGKKAITALRKAVKIEPKLPLAWKALGEVMAAQGDEQGSLKAYRQYLTITVKHPELIRAANCLYAGKLAKTEHLCREFLKTHPTDVNAINMLAEVGIRLSQFEDAKNLLERCLELAPDYHLARKNYTQVLFKQTKYEQALAQLKQLLEIEPDNPSYLLLKAGVLQRTGEHQPAIEIYEQVLTHYPRQAGAQMSYGHALKTVGRLEDGIDAYRACIQLAPSMGEAYWSLANLKTFRFEEHEIATMREQVSSLKVALEKASSAKELSEKETSGKETSRPVAAKRSDIKDYYHLCFALGKALEDQNLYDESFENYSLGNAVRCKTVRYDADDNHRNSQRLIDFFDAGFFAERAGQGCLEPDPIFVVGLPRAGSTLLEQILASHSQVEGTMELPDIISIARRLGGKKRRADENRYPHILAELTARQLAELGEEYLARTRIQRSTLPFFIDKMPNNFSHIGLIHLILPNARIIDARRQPMACCFSDYKQLFAHGQNFTYDLEDIGRYYRDYVELMDHWDRVLPGCVLRIHYEDVVADTAAQVRRLLDYCGLPYEDQCLKFHETDRAITTPSSEQVRQPIYTGAVEQWRHFRSHLDSLINALGDEVLARYPID